MSDGAPAKNPLSTLGHAIERWLQSERDQVPLWIPVLLGLGIAAWFRLPNPSLWFAWCCGALAIAASGLAMAEGSRLRAVLLGAGLLACLGCILVWAKAELVGERPLARAVFVEMEARIGRVEPLPSQGMTRLLIEPVGQSSLPGRLRVNVADRDMRPEFRPGTVIAFRVRLMPPAPPAVPGAYDFAERAYFLGIGGTGRALAPIRLVEPSASRGLDLRQRLSRHIQGRLPGGEGAIAAALATGDRGAIMEEDAEAMRRSGLAHLLSISGLHVTALVGLVIFATFRLLALNSRWALHWPLMLIAAGAGAAAGIGYTLLTGYEVPTVRSCVAALLALGALALGRDALTLRLVAAAAVFVLLLWPEALTGPSFQMSFAAIVAIVALGESAWFRHFTAAREEGMVRRLGRGLAALFLTGIAVEAALAPIALFHFHKAGLLGSLANLIAIPLTTFVVMPFEAAALLLDAGGVGAPFWWIAGRALALLLALAHTVAASPFAVASLPAFPAWAFSMAVVGGLWCLLWRSRLRLAGLVPLGAGAAVMALTPQPDLLVTGDGRHVAFRLADGHMALLRNRAGDYVRDMLSESAGYEGDLAAVAALREARCSPDLCAVRMRRGGMAWTVLATRSSDRLSWRRFVGDCARADIVVSDRRLPRGCTPRWLKLDRAFLARSGGVAVYLDDRRLRAVRRSGDRHPWIPAPPNAGNQL